MNKVNLTRVDLNLLVVFDAVATTRSVTAAAAQLSLSQSAVSHALNRLRGVLGDPLFVRSRDRLVPTCRGSAMVEPVRDILAAVGRVLDDSDFNPLESRRAFRIAMDEYALLAVLPGLMGLLRKHAPNMTLQASPTGADTLRQLEGGLADAAFWGCQPQDPHYRTSLLFSDTYIGVMCRSHPLAARIGHAPDLNAYLSYPHLRSCLSQMDTDPVDLALAAQRIVRRVALSSCSVASAIASLSGTDLLMAVPRRLVALTQSRELAVFDLPIEVAAYPCHQVWHRRLEDDPASVWLRRIASSLFAEGDPPSDRNQEVA